MATLENNDLQHSQDLDQKAMEKAKGGHRGKLTSWPLYTVKWVDGPNGFPFPIFKRLDLKTHGVMSKAMKKKS